jgi:hypothetical protein
MMDRIERARRRAASQRERVARRRADDPSWWQSYLARNAAYRRDRAAIDPEYRHERNLQAK